MSSLLFIHLPIRSADVLSDVYGPGPQPYDPLGQYQRLDTPAPVAKPLPEMVATEQIIDEGVTDGEQYIERSLQNIMFEFVDSNKRNEWPSRTDVHCWWCCSHFDSPPCAIPKKYVGGVFYLYGCFCSYNCAAAYNFDKKGDLMWESYSLLHFLYKKLYGEEIDQIIPAPPKEILTMFGGETTIEEYRELLVMNRNMYRIIDPPMVSIIPKVENNNLNLEKIRKRKKYIPFSAMNDLESTQSSEVAVEDEQTKSLKRFFNN